MSTIAIAAMACWSAVGDFMAASVAARTSVPDISGAFAGAARGHTCRFMFSQL